MKKNRIFLKIARKNLPWLAISLVAAYILTSVTVKGGTLLSNAIDKLLSENSSGIINMDFMKQLFLFVGIGFAASLVRDLCASQFSVNIKTKFREEAGEKLVRLEFKYFDQNTSGTILNKLISDIEKAGRFFSETFPDICRIFVEAITIIISIGQMDGMLVIFLAIGYPFVMLISNYSSKRMAKLAKNRWKKIDEMNSLAYDNIQGIVVGRSFNLIPMMKEKLDVVINQILNFEFRRNKLSAVSWILGSVVNWLPNIILATLALQRVLSGHITIGEMTYFVLMLDRIIHPLSELPSLFNDGREISVSIHRLEELMGQEEEPSGTYANMGSLEVHAHSKETEQASSNIKNYNAVKPAKKAVIEFEHIDFSYNTENPVLRDVTFTIHGGEQVAFVGGSGEGKSTIFKLLCGFYQKEAGGYRLFGKSFEEWDLNAARSLFSLVSQNVFLFPETIAENVAYGCQEATMEEIKNACRFANIHNFIESLPEKYDTLAGERGARLSGGERQRISIARAFLKNAPILLLDEPTSAIDVGTENLIKEAIARISKGRTVITIAHRLSTIEDADRIMVLSKGQIAESGTNEELLLKKGVYHNLYEVQKRIQNRVEDGVEESVQYRVKDNIEERAHNRVKDNIEESVQNRVKDNIEERVKSRVEESVQEREKKESVDGTTENFSAIN